MIKTAVILAAGCGERLDKAIKQDKPKGFVELEGLSLIERSINNLKSVGISKIIIGTGYLSSYYESLVDNRLIFCVKNNSYANSGSFYTLYNLRYYLNADFLLLESDLLYEKNALHILMNDIKKDVILSSGKTSSGDEVFIEVGEKNLLVNISKNQSDLSDVYSELVGISKISLDTYKMLLEWGMKNLNKAKKIDYENALVEIANKRKIYVKKVDDLIWAEIDTKEHYKRVLDHIYPKLLNIKE